MYEGKPTRLEALVTEAQRVLAICNACRYCEGYCAVFPALERRLDFQEADVHYLANLCHNCGACFQACQYAPPHEFALDFPLLLSQVRKETYKEYVKPAFLAQAFETNAAFTSIAIAAGLVAILVFMSLWSVPGNILAAHPDWEGSFYAVMPHAAMAAIFGAAAIFVLGSIAWSVLDFWTDLDESPLDLAAREPLSAASWDAAGLRYLDGGGAGCTAPDGRATTAGARRVCHHFVFYGFVLCFAATCVGTVYHYVFGFVAPYPAWSLPVILGTVGGIAMVVGCLGLLRLFGRRDPRLADATQRPMDAAFLVLLLLVAATGLALLALRESPAMGVLLAVHLALVLALFVTLPYGKFVHAPYRLAALVRFHLERRRPLPQIGSE